MSRPDPLLDGLLMLSFEGRELPVPTERILSERSATGMTVFRDLNYDSPSQLRDLIDHANAASADALPLLVATDQETGQLFGVGAPATPFPGNMALGAIDDTDLTRRVGIAIGNELRALGINVNYAPVADLNTNPANPSLGIRSFGDDPAAVARHVAAMVEGLQAAGVAATMKHFPGKGDARTDSHYGLPVLDHDRARLDSVELAPFRAAVAAGVKLAMSGHFALPALTYSRDLPLTLAPEAQTTLLRDELGFDGVSITDALDMKALTQGWAQVIDVIAAVRAGIDLLLLTASEEGMLERTIEGLHLGRSRRLIRETTLEQSAVRRTNLRRWVAGFTDPGLEIVGSMEHRALAGEAARRAITVVRDGGMLPLRPGRVLVVQPEPTNLTPADTSAEETPSLADRIRARGADVTSIVIPHEPAPSDIAAVADRASGHEVVVAGTVNAPTNPAQAEMVAAVIATGTPTITVALRTPYDLLAYPDAVTHLAVYSITEPAMEALAAVLFGERRAQGALPVAIEGLYPRGHRAG